MIENKNIDETTGLRCEKRIQIEMNQILLLVLQSLLLKYKSSVQSTSILAKIMECLGRNNENRITFVENLVFFKERKNLIVHELNRLDGHRLMTSLKGKKNSHKKKNIPCQPYDTKEEAVESIAKTSNLLDYLLVNHNVNPLDLSQLPDYNKYDDSILNNTCFLQTCHPEDMGCFLKSVENRYTNPPPSPPTDDDYQKASKTTKAASKQTKLTTHKLMCEKRKISKIYKGADYNCCLSSENNELVICYNVNDMDLWLTSDKESLSV